MVIRHNLYSFLLKSKKPNPEEAKLVYLAGAIAVNVLTKYAATHAYSIHITIKVIESSRTGN